MFLLTGITGHVGGAAARKLLSQGKAVRALVRDPSKAAAWAGQGVELVAGDWNDSAAMTQALQGVEGAYLMMPPLQAPQPGFPEAKGVLASYVEALRNAPPPRVVALSSMGSEKESGLGLITSTSLMERAFADLPMPTAFVRAGGFFENYLFALQVAQSGTLPSFYAPTDRELPMVATADIGALVAELLTSEWKGRRIVELGSVISPDEIAGALSDVLGRDVKAQPVPRQAWAPALEGMGLPKGSTWGYEEMLDGVNSGWITFGVPGTEHVAAKTTAKQVFAAAKEA